MKNKSIAVLAVPSFQDILTELAVSSSRYLKDGLSLSQQKESRIAYPMPLSTAISMESKLGTYLVLGIKPFNLQSDSLIFFARGDSSDDKTYRISSLKSHNLIFPYVIAYD